MSYLHLQNTLKAIALTVPAARAFELTVEFVRGEGKDTATVGRLEVWRRELDIDPIREGQKSWYTVSRRSTPMTRARDASILCLATAAALLSGCGSATVSGERQVGTAAPGAPGIVYVTDFELDASDVRSQRGILPPPLPLPPGLGDALPKLPGTPVEPAVRARQLVELMATTLVKDLTGKGVTARRLVTRDQLPDTGWLVRGVFTDVQEGNQFRRAVIGFGAGQTQLQVLVAIDDLTRGTPKPIYEVDTKADSGRLPGAAITLNPYVAAARFALSGSDLDRNVRQTAAQIAERVTQYMAAP